MNGRVYKSTGSWYTIKLPDNNFVNARIKGKFRIKGIKSTNPVAVGDIVSLKKEKDNNSYIITEIHPRKNYLIRKSINLSKRYHILAANIDQVIILISLINPKTYTAFIDRILVTAEAYNITPVLAFNKTDLYTTTELSQKLKHLTQTYQNIGYQTLHTSVKNNKGLQHFRQLITQKTSLLIGHSGVGKSSIINTLYPELQLKTAEISEQHLTGKHTTTFAEMFDLDHSTTIIDTPGVRGFGLINFEKQELSYYFPEMRQHLHQCKFNNCVHINEPGCAIKQAVQNKQIAEFRYQNYLSMYFNDEDETFRSKGY